MEIIIISAAAFLTAILTFFSGFGLGTILTPVFIIFFPVDLSIALTGIVHFVNNIFKLILVGKSADRSVLIRFGVTAVIAAFIGAWLLGSISDMKPILTYEFFDSYIEVTPLKAIISVVLIFFSLFELIPALKKISFSKDKLPIGGLLSGFFGGLSGHQGALRSAFLIKAGLTKEAFIGTGVVIACFIDFTRLSVYSTRFMDSGLGEYTQLVIFASASAILGAFIGKKLLTKITLEFVQQLVGIMLILISLALGLGWI